MSPRMYVKYFSTRRLMVHFCVTLIKVNLAVLFFLWLAAFVRLVPSLGSWQAWDSLQKRIV